MRVFKIFILSIFLFSSCQRRAELTEMDLDSNPILLREAQGKLTDVIVHDIFSPPVASRIYAYTSIAAYEGIQLGDQDYRSLAYQLNGLSEGPQPEDGLEYSYHLVSLSAFYLVAKALVFSETEIVEHRNKALESIKKSRMPNEVYERSVALGEKIGTHILTWAAQDNYHQTRSFEKYSIREDPSTWKPTPPAYMEGIEPHWTRIRTLVMDSSNQFIPERPTQFSLIKESDFYKEAIDVYEIGKNLTEEQIEIANFWDCNPYKMNVKGHVTFATKKITPGGHWMEIACLASKKANANWMKTTEALTITSIALGDGFISCWDEKYRSIVIRPETFINQYIDEDWVPLLQTPPFPEYTSGHSVISTAASKVLTSLFGENFEFEDTTEQVYGLAPRTFKSFAHAAEEAAMSRLYGGIHYMPAIENGVKQGAKIGDLVLRKVKLKQANNESIAELGN
jgi:hypothetical protein